MLPSGGDEFVQEFMKRSMGSVAVVVLVEGRVENDHPVSIPGFPFVVGVIREPDVHDVSFLLILEQGDRKVFHHCIAHMLLFPVLLDREAVTGQILRLQIFLAMEPELDEKFLFRIYIKAVQLSNFSDECIPFVIGTDKVEEICNTIGNDEHRGIRLQSADEFFHLLSPFF